LIVTNRLAMQIYMYQYTRYWSKCLWIFS